MKSLDLAAISAFLAQLNFSFFGVAVDGSTEGDIAAVVGMKNVRTGDTIHEEGFDIMLEPPAFPDPVISVAVLP